MLICYIEKWCHQLRFSIYCIFLLSESRNQIWYCDCWLRKELVGFWKLHVVFYIYLIFVLTCLSSRWAQFRHTIRCAWLVVFILVCNSHVRGRINRGTGVTAVFSLVWDAAFGNILLPLRGGEVCPNTFYLVFRVRADDGRNLPDDRLAWRCDRCRPMVREIEKRLDFRHLEQSHVNRKYPGHTVARLLCYVRLV